MDKRIVMMFIAILGVLACRSEKPAIPISVPAEKTADETPDVIKIAVWFIEFEGVTGELSAGSARVVSQDREAYYVGFRRKILRPHRTPEVVVKVYKKNGLAEWEDY